VVDAGGAGVVELLRGAISGLRGTALRGTAELSFAPRAAAHADWEDSVYRYCTNFLVLASRVEPAALEADLRPLGDCLIVVGDPEAIKVHVHTDDPGRALSFGSAAGGLAGVDVADMHAQIDDRRTRATDPGRRVGRHLSVVPEPDGSTPAEHRVCDVVSVLVGDGNETLAREQGVRGVVVGGQSANPSIQELVAAIEGCAADGVVLLPNNPNVQRAAEEAAASASRPCRVIASPSIAVGLSLLVHYEPERSMAANAEAMTASLAGIAYGEVTRAVRDARVDGLDVRSGQYVGLMGGRIVVAADRFQHATSVVLQHLAESDPDVLTILLGAGFSDRAGLDDALGELAGREIEVEVVEGGQPHYELLLAAE
jgi:dihydroxyacetone kinase-like predicted kinase